MSESVTYTPSLIERLTAPMGPPIGPTDGTDKLSKLSSALGTDGLLSGLAKGFGRLIGGPINLAKEAVQSSAGDAIALDEQFARINVKAQLDGPAFEKLKADIIDMARKNKVDVMIAPAAFERIISSTGDADLSMQILDSTLKGSKAGFAEASVVADALSQSLSIVGSDSATAAEVMDTFFAATRVGSGGLDDSARYMPSLIAEGNDVGVKYKEVAGIYAYMTGKGQSADSASALISSMFSTLGRSEVTDKMSEAGINIFEGGQMRPSVDIFRDMSTSMSGMNTEQKSGFIEALGVTNSDAQSAFMVMTADMPKLQSTLIQCAEAAGETDRALDLSANTARRTHEIWASFGTSLTEAGLEVLPIVDAGLSALGWTLDTVGSSVRGMAGFLGGWYKLLDEGNPLVWGATAAIGSLGAVLLANEVRLRAVSAWTKIKVAWDTIMEAKSKAAAVSMALFNTTLLASPWTWAIAGISAVAGALIGIKSRTQDSTRSLAEFNAELHSSKQEAGDMFEAAQKAAIGSRQRAEGIAAINDKYREYLPNMLAESATNEEIATALSSVNTQLEVKLQLKFKEAELGKQYDKLGEITKSFFENFQERIKDKDQDEQLRLIKIAGRLAEDVRSAKITPKEASARIEKEGVKTIDYLGGGVSSYGVVSGRGEVNWAAYLFENLNKASKAVDFEIQKTNAIFRLDSPSVAEPSASAPLPDYLLPAAPRPQATPTPKASLFNQSNNHWSTDSVVWPFIVRPNGSEASTTNLTRAATGPEDYGNNPRTSSRTLDLERFCDQIVINIAKADNEGVDEIRTKVMEVLKEVIDGYNA